jgi:thiamine biosynthesis lipoprotein
MEAERRFRAMGSDAHVIVTGRMAPVLAAGAVGRIDELERRWSRFIATSEVSRLNDAAGSPVVVSPDTALLVSTAMNAFWLSGCSFDPTVLGDVVRAGYDRTFESLPGTSGASSLSRGCSGIRVDGTTVLLPAGTGFDPGGIGKGLAADIVVRELLAAGADGACVNLGGDLRVAGVSPSGSTWTVAVEHPALTAPLAMIGLASGAVATSTTLRRQWHVDGQLRHHLIDPGTGEPSTSDLDLVAVVAGDAWAAEILAKAVLLRGSSHPFDLLGGTGAEAIAVTRTGHVLRSPGLHAFIGAEVAA